MAVSQLQTANTSTVSVTATAGAISDNLTAETANITTGTATLLAALGISSGAAPADLGTDVTTIDARNTGLTGDIQINEVAAGTAIDVQRLAQTNPLGAGNILLTTEAGTITVLVGGQGVTTLGTGGRLL